MIVGAFVRPLLTLAAAVAYLTVAVAAQADRPSASDQQRPAAGQAQADPAATQQPGDYVGEATCLNCHEAQARGYRNSAHGRAWRAGTPMASQGCESCHGPGKGHVNGSGDKSKIRTLKAGTKASEINAQCLDCHTEAERALWEGSSHDARHLSCVTCHSIHAPKSEAGQLRTVRQLETCQTCHRSLVGKFTGTSHMPVGEGKLDCSSCHNPHGSTNTKLLKVGNTVNESCESCHADKRGPHLWEHSPVVQDCTTCHDAHGSRNDRMLVAKQPMLCQRCHVSAQHPSTVYDGYQLAYSTSANRVYGRSCGACHQNIHGSNAPSGKAFLR